MKQYLKARSLQSTTICNAIKLVAESALQDTKLNRRKLKGLLCSTFRRLAGGEFTCGKCPFARGCKVGSGRTFGCGCRTSTHSRRIDHSRYTTPELVRLLTFWVEESKVEEYCVCGHTKVHHKQGTGFCTYRGARGGELCVCDCNGFRRDYGRS